MAAGRRDVSVIGPMPPFVGGAAKNTKKISERIANKGVHVTIIPTNDTKNRSEHRSDIKFHVERLFILIRNSASIMKRGLKNRREVAYIVPDGGLGVAYTLVYSLLCGLFFDKLYFHHRNYSHFNKKNIFMDLIVRATRNNARHIFLDSQMRVLSRDLYGEINNSYVVDNAAFCDVPALKCKERLGAGLKVGYLSNLTEEKGFDTFCEFAELLSRKNPEIEFLVAGRPVDIKNEERLSNLSSGLGGRIKYFGEIFGESKNSFFESCDVFVFPTRFSQEAQPNVVFEAMAAGNYIVATEWAGIPYMVTGAHHDLTPVDEHTAQAMANIVSQLALTLDMDACAAEQVRVFLQKRQASEAELDRLIEDMVAIDD